MITAIPIFEAKNTLTKCVHEVEKSGPIVLTRHNKEVAVLVSKSDYDSLKQNTFFDRLESFKTKYASELESIDSAFENVRQGDTGRSNEGGEIW